MKENEAKHTAGPWRFVEGTKGAMSSIYAKEEFRIAYVTTESINQAQRAEDICNGKLIAKAPELLEAMRKVADFLGNFAVTVAMYGDVTTHGKLKDNQIILKKAMGEYP